MNEIVEMVHAVMEEHRAKSLFRQTDSVEVAEDEPTRFTI